MPSYQSPDQTDRVLLETLAQGTDTEATRAFTEIDNRYRAALIQYAMKQGNATREDAEDSVQKVLIKLWEQRKESLGIQQLANYLGAALNGRGQTTGA